MATHRSFRGLSRALTLRAEEVTGNSGDILRKASLATLTTVTFATPVDTGRARSNWNVNFNSVDTSTEEPSPGSIQASINSGSTTISQYSTGRGNIFISNSLPYIERLENGFSRQAPAGMLRFGVDAFERVVDSLRLFRRP